MADISVQIVLDGQRYEQQLKAAETQAKKSGDKIGDDLGPSVTSRIGKSFLALGPAIAAAGAAIAGAFTLKEMIAQASEGEAALNKFNSALRAQGTFTREASADFAAYTSELQKVSVFGDDVIQRSAATLVSVGNLQGQALKDATKASIDFAAALDMDLGTAMDLVAKAAAGQTSALTRYGITIDKNIPESEKFAAVLAKINDRFGGFGQSQINTFSGALAQARNNFGDLLEEFGRVITQSPTVRNAIRAISDSISRITERIAEFTKDRDLIGEFVTAFIPVGEGIARFVIAPIELAFNRAKIIFNAISTLGAGLATFMLSITEQILRPAALFSESARNALEEVRQMREESQQSFSDFASKTGEAVKNGLSLNVTETVTQWVGGLAQLTEAVKPAAEQTGKEIGDAATPKPNITQFDEFTKAFLDRSKVMQQGAKQLGATMQQTFDTGLTNSFSAMGAAIAKGQNAFEAFGFAIIGVLGDMALQAGAFFLSLGIAKAIASLGTDPSAYALIAAGAGLSILGGALKAVAGMGGGGAPVAVGPAPPPPGGGGLAASSVGAVTETSAASTELAGEPRERQSQVIVQIQGNVLDRRETGLEIAEILNDTLRSSGQTVIRGESFA